MHLIFIKVQQFEEKGYILICNILITFSANIQGDIWLGIFIANNPFIISNFTVTSIPGAFVNAITRFVFRDLIYILCKYFFKKISYPRNIVSLRGKSSLPSAPHVVFFQIKRRTKGGNQRFRSS